MEVATWFRAIIEMILKEKTCETQSDRWKTTEDATGKAGLIYIQSWISHSNIEEQLRTKQEKDDRKGRKSYVMKIKELLQGLRRCGIFTMSRGFAVGRNWKKDKSIYIIRGNIGREIWAMRFGGISKT